jgi:hypothetical protein
MKAYVRFSVVGAVAIVCCAGVMAMLYAEGPERRAIALSAGVALGVQLVAFAIVQLAAAKNVIAAWGLGALLRLAVLVTYVLVVVRALELPSAAASLSLALFLFVSTLLEPLFLTS